MVDVDVVGVGVSTFYVVVGCVVSVDVTGYGVVVVFVGGVVGVTFDVVIAVSCCVDGVATTVDIVAGAVGVIVIDICAVVDV